MFIRNLKSYLKSGKPEQWRWLDNCLTDFKPDESVIDDHNDIFNLYYVIKCEELENFLPSMIYLTFVSLLNYPDLGRREKVAWIIPFLFKGDNYIITFEKFGLRLRAKNKNIDDFALKELLSKFKSATKIGDKILEPAVKKQIEKGNITLKNKYYIFNDMYKFFRNKAKNSYTKKSQDNNAQDKNVFSDLAKNINMKIENNRHGFYYSLAMLDAFFSMLEHLCILMLPFVNYNHQDEDLNELIFSRWTEKFNKVFKPQNNPERMKVYNKLNNIKEKYRNTFAHGGYEKNGVSLIGIHTEVGAVPITLSQTKDSVHYSFFPVKKDDFKTICENLDEFEHMLTQSPFERIMKIIKSGIDIYFDGNNRKKYKEIICDENKLEKYIKTQHYYKDMYTNMDW